MIIIFCIMIMLTFVYNSDIIISGASYGLMLWYKNVLPLLLPFMLISGIMINSLKSSEMSSKSKSWYAILITILLGVLCGYPLGAKTASDFVSEKIYSQETGNILLPLCNNSSPMFISGYVVYTILENKISLFHALLAIYLPYLISVAIRLTYHQTKKQKSLQTSKPDSRKTRSEQNDYMLNAIIQITYVGIYIMLCSVIIEFIFNFSFISKPYTEILAGCTEITRGLMVIKNSMYFDTQIKTALILAITSFGGISALFQTKKVIKSSGLSLVNYIIIKLLCSMGTMGLVILFL